MPFEADVVSAYRNRMPIVHILNKFNFKNSWDMYKVLKSQGVKPDRHQFARRPRRAYGKSIPSGIGLPRSVNSGKTRHHYTREDDLYIVQAFVRAAHEMKEGFVVTWRDLKKWFPAGTNIEAVYNRLRRLGWMPSDTDAARKASKLTPPIPGPSINKIPVREMGRKNAARLKKPSVTIIPREETQHTHSEEIEMDGSILVDELEDFIATCRSLGVKAVVWG